MPFNIVRDDLVHLRADAIILPSDEELVIDGGAGLAVAKIAGRHRLNQALKKIGHCSCGEAVATPAFKFPAHHLIHAVGPVWSEAFPIEQRRRLLRSAYDSALELACTLGDSSVALPLLSTGTFGCPAHISLEIALDSIRDFLEDNELEVTLVLYDRRTVAAALEVFDSVASFIDDTYVDQHRETANYSTAAPSLFGAPARGQEPLGGTREAAERPAFGRHHIKKEEPEFSDGEGLSPEAASSLFDASFAEPAPGMAQLAPEQDLRAMLNSLDEGFSQTLLTLIDERGFTDATVYKRANISRQLFSKIRNDPSYRPKKSTAVALCVALELNLDEAKDLLSRAGYAFSHASKFDVIIEYFLSCGTYDVFAINETLFAFDQPLLGEKH